MTKEVTIDNPICPRCEGWLTLSFPEDDDGSYSVEKDMAISVECWECNITGTAWFTMTDIEIEDDESEDEDEEN